MLGRYHAVISRRCGSSRQVLLSSSSLSCSSYSSIPVGDTLRNNRLSRTTSATAPVVVVRWHCASAPLAAIDPEPAKEVTPQHEQQQQVQSSTHTHRQDTPPSQAALHKTQQSQSSSDATKAHLQQLDLPELIYKLQRAAEWNDRGDEEEDEVRKKNESLWGPYFCAEAVQAYDTHLHAAMAGTLSTADCELLLSADTVILAFKTVVNTQYDPDQLSQKVRQWERALGQLKRTPLTDQLSLCLLTANSKAGNVGRVLQLLQLRKARGFDPQKAEFRDAVESIKAAMWKQAQSRNLFMSDAEQPELDNPTRWLDAILLNMHDRGYPLTTSLANRMLMCYSHAGKTGKAVHHFYRVVRHPVGGLPPDERPEDVSGMPKGWFYVDNLGYSFQPIKVRLKYHRGAPPFYKIPSQVRGKLLFRKVDGAVERKGQFKLERETEPEYSLPLAAAFAFADSLQHGVCGHAPIKLDTWSYNALIKASVHRGALWRAMHVLDEMMPTAECKPNVVSYNWILAGLALVGDVTTAQEYYRKMLNTGMTPDTHTVRAVVDGLLNLGDAPGAVTVVQDFFNQHSVLPPYSTHLKILEFCLAREMIHEAKRYVYFIQQLWHWQPNAYHSEEFIKSMQDAKQDPQLQKEPLQQLFAYFGEKLEDSDFL